MDSQTCTYHPLIIPSRNHP